MQIKKVIKRLCVLIIFASSFLAAGWANATVIYDELSDGDLGSNDTENLILGIGVNIIKGSSFYTVTAGRDWDDFLFTLGPGMTLDSINYIFSEVSLLSETASLYTYYTLYENNYGLNGGTLLGSEVGLQITGSSPVSMFSSSFPLSIANTYAMDNTAMGGGGGSIENVGGSWNYEFQINVSSSAEPIPEPATILLLGTGLVGAAGAARRKKKSQA